ncbi:MAG: RluA family pseudouridine synthase [Tissierellia bacterium]|nr:RluA family pseudouridine synthase [Tissierellia bacterium]
MKIKNKNQNLVFKVDSKIKTETFLGQKNISNRALRNIKRDNLMIINDKREYSTILNKNDIVKIIIKDEKLDYEPFDKKIDVLYEDSQILIVDKPKNLTVNSKNQISLSNLVSNYFLKNNIKSKVRLINRLDMNTSGIIMIAKNKYAMSFYQKEIENNNIKKLYTAYVKGDFQKEGLYQLYLSYNDKNKRYEVGDNGKLSKTEIFKISYKNGYSLLLIRILTGKTHQIRSTLSYLNYPIVGDKLYGSDENCDGFLLNSSFLYFNEFLTGKRIKVESKFINNGIFQLKTD